MESLLKKENIGDILTTQYDIALNGFEIGGGSIRNHQAEALKKVFEIMGHQEDKIHENFGHMLESFSFGATARRIAWGLDRLMAILMNEPKSVRSSLPKERRRQGPYDESAVCCRKRPARRARPPVKGKEGKREGK